MLWSVSFNLPDATFEFTADIPFPNPKSATTHIVCLFKPQILSNKFRQPTNNVESKVVTPIVSSYICNANPHLHRQCMVIFSFVKMRLSMSPMRRRAATANGQTNTTHMLIQLLFYFAYRTFLIYILLSRDPVIPICHMVFCVADSSAPLALSFNCRR